MKTQTVKKQLWIESGIVVVVTIVLGAGLWYLDTMNGDSERANEMLGNEVRSVTNDMTTLQEKYAKIQKNGILYHEAMQKSAHNELTLNRQTVGDKFNQFKQDYYLNNVHLNMAPVQEMTGAQYKRKTSTMVSSDVSVDFVACSDEHIYDVLDSMQQQLSGAIKITRLALTREVSLSGTVLDIASRTGVCPLVRGVIKFLWIGIKPIDINDINANVQK